MAKPAVRVIWGKPMSKSKMKCVKSKAVLKAIDKSLDALEKSRKFEEKLAKQQSKAIAALLELEALVEDAGNCKCASKKKKSKSKVKKTKSKKVKPSIESSDNSHSGVASLIDSLSSVRATAIDDLELIAGVGPKLAVTLNELGISTYEQIAEWTEEDIKRVDEHLNFPGRIVRENWIEQAKALAAGGREEYIRVFGKEPR